jgi:hypothetical protein
MGHELETRMPEHMNSVGLLFGQEPAIDELVWNQEVFRHEPTEEAGPVDFIERSRGWRTYRAENVVVRYENVAGWISIGAAAAARRHPLATS